VEEWWTDRVVYEVFVRSFVDSDGDGVGDLAGLTARLDDLNDGDPATTTDLGVDALWLMPIFESPSYHGYDVVDYGTVEKDYGTNADLDALVEAAHRRGMKVILDFVMNHTSSQHPWFVDSQSGPGAARRSWYSWRATDPGWTRPWDGSGPTWHLANGAYYYGLFWSGMPDLSYSNPDVEAEMVGAMRFWLARGVDGFRLDAVRYLVETDAGQADLPETHALLRRVRAALASEHPDVLLVGEAWTAIPTVATYWGSGDELHLAFNFELAEGIKASVASGDAADFRTALALTNLALSGKDRGFDAPFLSNHDMVRVLRALGGSGSAGRVAAAVLLALPGTPFLYYGEEIGMQGGDGAADQAKRTPYRWTSTAPGYGFTTGTPWTSAPEAAGVDLASQKADPGSLWHLYRRLLALRKSRPALSRGDVSLPGVTGGGPGAVALLRAHEGVRVLFVANLATGPSGPFNIAAAGSPVLLEGEGISGTPSPSGGEISFPGLDARGFAFYALD
jgi:glycosidase